MITTKESNAEAVTVTANGIDFSVRFVTALGATPDNRAKKLWKVVEVNGVPTFWIIFRGKTSNDLIAKSKFEVCDTEGNSTHFEDWARLDAAQQYIESRTR